jgi:hypothetical protein
MSHKSGFISNLWIIITLACLGFWVLVPDATAGEDIEPTIVVQPIQTHVDAALTGTWRVVQIFNDATAVVEPVAEDGSAVTMSFGEFGVSIRGGCKAEDLAGIVDKGAYTLNIEENALVNDCEGYSKEERRRFHQSLPGSGFYTIVADKLYIFALNGWLRLVLLKNP